MNALHDDSPEPGIRFDRDKFCDTVHFIIAGCAGDRESLGKNKLHKSLYYSDMLSYIDAGRPITGVDYIREPFGPVARYLSWALRELEKEGKIKVEKRNFFGLEKCDFLLCGKPRSNAISDDEKELLRIVIEFVCGHSVKEISEISHAAPWKSVEMGERIPYASAFLLLPPRRPTRREIELADERRKLALDLRA